MCSGKVSLPGRHLGREVGFAFWLHFNIGRKIPLRNSLGVTAVSPLPAPILPNIAILDLASGLAQRPRMAAEESGGGGQSQQERD